VEKIMKTYEYRRNNLLISTDKSKLDVNLIHDYLANQSYWAKGIPNEIVKKSIEGSICFGIYEAEKQIGFARVISDCATFAYLCDVFVLEAYRGNGASKFLMECIIQNPDLQGLRRWSLATYDAHGLYEKFGFSLIARPDRAMEILNMDVYLNSEKTM
jgi:GNAT superfamily N-acetyltransferase